MQKHINVLVTAVGGDVGMSTVRALHQHGYNIIGTDATPFCVVENMLSKFYQVPYANDANYTTTLQNIIKKNKVTVVLPTSEQEIFVLAQPSKIHNLCFLATLPHEKLQILFTKAKTMAFLEALGCKVPKTTLLDEKENFLSFPLIAKPDYGRGSSGIFFVENQQDLEYYRTKNLSSYILQEYIGSPEQEYTTGVFSNGLITHSLTFKRKLVSGYSQKVIPVEDPTMKSLSVTIAKALNLIGCINIQTRKVGQDHFIFEINPRISSTVMFRSLLGFHDAHWWIQTLLGKTYSYNPQPMNCVGIRHLNEHFFYI